MVKERIVKFIDENQLIKPGDLVVAGVSGGPDSMVMLFLLQELRQTLNFSLQVAHINHNLRPSALTEQQLVEAVCHKLQVNLHLKSVDIETIARQERKSLELAGREQRYLFFTEILQRALEEGVGKIATAHHQDDQAETVLLHFLRGSGLKGLRGIQPHRGRIIRPLLCLSRKEILTYAAQNQIVYVEDQSNLDPSYTRNRVRHHLLPLIQAEFNPQIVAAIGRLTEIIGDEDDFLEQVTDQYWQEICLEQGNGYVFLKVKPLRALPPAGQRRILLRAVYHVQDQMQNWEMHDIERIRELLNKEGSAKKVTGKYNLTARKIYDKIFISTNDTISSRFCYPLTIPGTVDCIELSARFVFTVLTAKEQPQPHYDWKVDYNAFQGETVFLRSWQPGDALQITGLSGRKKVKKVFNERKIPQTMRKAVPILATTDKVLGILGLVISPQLQVTDQTEKILYIRREEIMAGNEGMIEKGTIL